MPALITLGLMIVAALFLYAYAGGGQSVQQVLAQYGICPNCPFTPGGCMGKLSASQIMVYAQNAGFLGADLETAIAIALAESSGNPQAKGDNGDSIGLWQIDTRYHPEFAGQDLTDPQTNANAAYSVYAATDNSFTPWSTFKNNAYTAYINDARNAVTA